MGNPNVGLNVHSKVIHSRHKHRSKRPRNHNQPITIERQPGPPPPGSQRPLHSRRTRSNPSDQPTGTNMGTQPPIDRKPVRTNRQGIVDHRHTRHQSLVRRPNRNDKRRKTSRSNSITHGSKHHGGQTTPLIRRINSDLQATSGIRSNTIERILGSPNNHLIPATRRKRRPTPERHHDPPRHRHPTVEQRHHQMRPPPSHPPPSDQQARQAPLHEPRRFRRVRNRIHRLEKVRPLRQRHDLHG